MGGVLQVRLQSKGNFLIIGLSTIEPIPFLFVAAGVLLGWRDFNKNVIEVAHVDLLCNLVVLQKMTRPYAGGSTDTARKRGKLKR
eukprot:scaffold593_cov126-Cylindrotheca_fusiformis.AAC.9